MNNRFMNLFFYSQKTLYNRYLPSKYAYHASSACPNQSYKTNKLWFEYIFKQSSFQYIFPSNYYLEFVYNIK